MRTSRCFASLGLVIVTVACGDEQAAPLAPSAHEATSQLGFTDFAWSEPVWLGPVVNSPARDLNPELSPDGLSLYFTSQRDGPIRIYVTRRAAKNCPWGEPVALGPTINSPGNPNFTPAFSPDGLLLYFARGDHSGQDIYVSRREDPADDFAWGPPVKLGSEVNTADNEHSPAFLEAGGGELYFTRGLRTESRMWVVPMSRDGRFHGTARPVEEVNHPGVANSAMTVRRDGRELIFWSGGVGGERPGTLGSSDLFVSTRRSVNDPWSEPRSLGRPVNHEGNDSEATLSADGRTLIFASERAVGLGRPDLWMSERGPSAGAAQPCNVN